VLLEHKFAMRLTALLIKAVVIKTMCRVSRLRDYNDLST